MKILYSDVHRSHVPLYEIFNGHSDPHAEVPARVENIRNSLKKAGYRINTPIKEIPMSLLYGTHRRDYVDFIKEGSSYSYPSVFPYNHVNEKRKLVNPLARHGRFSFDLYTPMHRQIFTVARQSASLAYELANDLRDGRISAGYAMCRPPGHHAEYAKMGGYCYFNNSALAANYLSHNGRVAVLDVDFHHGNGTQNIFYERNDVLTISIHADPDWKFPYFTGFKHETGRGKGKGYNINYPLPKDTGNGNYQKTLICAIVKIKRFRPHYLIVPLGLDTHKDDPIGGFALSTDYYTKMARTIKMLGLPTLIVQEGGYNTKLLGNNVVAFLKGIS